MDFEFNRVNKNILMFTSDRVDAVILNGRVLFANNTLTAEYKHRLFSELEEFSHLLCNVQVFYQRNGKREVIADLSPHLVKTIELHDDFIEKADKLTQILEETDG